MAELPACVGRPALGFSDPPPFADRAAPSPAPGPQLSNRPKQYQCAIELHLTPEALGNLREFAERAAAFAKEHWEGDRDPPELCSACVGPELHERPLDFHPIPGGLTIGEAIHAREFGLTVEQQLEIRVNPSDLLERLVRMLDAQCTPEQIVAALFRERDNGMDVWTELDVLRRLNEAARSRKGKSDG